jgi:hypothetical protein
VSEHGDQLCLLGLTEYVPPQDGDRMQSSKRRVLNKTGRWAISRIMIVMPME